MPKLCAAALLLAFAHVLAQGPSDNARFDAVSIRRNTSSDSRQSLGGNPDLVGSNIPVWWLIRAAFQIEDFQLAEAPNWVFSDRFDVLAKPPAGTPRNLGRTMMRNLLADRFRLTTRTESREMPIYALLPARTDGSPGPRLTRSAIEDCEAARTTPRPCGMNVGGGRMRGVGVLMSEFVPLVQQFVGRTVVDKTGLAGRFDLELQFVSGLDAGGASPDGVSIFTALQEQLGLKLDAQRGPVQMLVIERIDRPTEN